MHDGRKSISRLHHKAYPGVATQKCFEHISTGKLKHTCTLQDVDGSSRGLTYLYLPGSLSPTVWMWSILIIFLSYVLPMLQKLLQLKSAVSMSGLCWRHNVADLFDFTSCTLAWHQASSASTGAGAFKGAGTTGNQKHQGVFTCASWCCCSCGQPCTAFSLTEILILILAVDREMTSTIIISGNHSYMCNYQLLVYKVVLTPLAVKIP